MTGQEHVVIAGGGIAGIAAALRLAERGVRVTILETRKKLGGRATSFLDTRSGQLLDNCQHVVLGCCVNYLDLLTRLGVADRIAWHDQQYWIEAGGGTSVIRPCPLPAPLHFTLATLRAAFLSRQDLAALARAGPAILHAKRSEHARRTFADFLHGCGQHESVIRRFWSPIVVSACNLDVDRVSASVALHVFQEGFFAHPAGARIGVPSVPLVQLYERVEELLARAGGQVIYGAGVEHLDERSVMAGDAGRFEASRDGGVICAVPVERVRRITCDRLLRSDPRLAALDQFTHSPILGVHIRFDRPVLTHPHAVLVDRPTQWLFRKDHLGAAVHAVVSAADSWLSLSEAEVGARIIADVHACFPDSRAAQVLSVRAVKEKLATFAPTPEVESIRPGVAGACSRLILAGDYTATGWPATMEGATRSGYMAAAAYLHATPSTLLAKPMRVNRLVRTLGIRPT